MEVSVVLCTMGKIFNIFPTKKLGKKYLNTFIIAKRYPVAETVINFELLPSLHT